MVKEYGHLLRHDPAYAQKAARVSSMAKDTPRSSARNAQRSRSACARQVPRKVAFHSPCSLQHGLKINASWNRCCRHRLRAYARAGRAPLLRLGGNLLVAEARHLGAAAAQQGERLESGRPELIATANIGCLAHIQSGTDREVIHWIELIDRRMVRYEVRGTRYEVEVRGRGTKYEGTSTYSL